jgi:hypothetical protein
MLEWPSDRGTASPIVRLSGDHLKLDPAGKAVTARLPLPSTLATQSMVEDRDAPALIR